jgi:hypothetical protein
MDYGGDMNGELIQIDWDGPFSIDNTDDLNDGKIDYGVYQIYGTHPVYGANVLLYIGKTDQQTFGDRIKQEGWGDADYTSDYKRIEIYVGRFAGEMTPSDDQWSRQIDLAGRLLILAHSPGYNSRGIDGPSSSVDYSDLENIHVLNWGAYKNLLPEVSGARWTNKLKGIPYTIFEYAEAGQ